MLHAPATETKQQGDAARNQPEPQRELHPRLTVSAALPASAAAIRGLPIRSPAAQRHQHLVALHTTYGNQAVLRMLERSRPAASAAGPVLQRQCACGGACPECREKSEGALLQRAYGGSAALPLQRKLVVNEPGDSYEQEADRVADQVMGMSEPTAMALPHQGACGGLQRATPGAPGQQAAPPIVHEVLRSPGQPLDAATRAFFEPRFGYDFSQVRVHFDERAADSARALDALAFTVGQHVVFGASQYAPTSPSVRTLLAHELAHVIQQGNTPAPLSVDRLSSPADSLEQAAEAAAAAVTSRTDASGPSIHSEGGSTSTLFRRVVPRLVHCTANTDYAPADPVAALTDVDNSARDFADQIAQSFADDAVVAQTGVPDEPSDTFQSYQDHFGLPPAEGPGFLNRLTGAVKPSQGVAMSEELGVLSRRFAIVRRMFGDFINYRCHGATAASFGGCTDDPCNGEGDAASCRGVDAIFLCPSFWDFDPSQQASVLIHEGFHIAFGTTEPRGVGQIGDETLRGSGRNFNIAGCYESVVPDVFGFDSVATCPEPP